MLRSGDSRGSRWKKKSELALDGEKVRLQGKKGKGEEEVGGPESCDFVLNRPARPNAQRRKGRERNSEVVDHSPIKRERKKKRETVGSGESKKGERKELNILQLY